MKQVNKKRYLKLALLYAVLSSAVLSSEAQAIAIRDIPNLTSVTFWERTGGSSPTPYTFGINSSQLTNQLNNPLGIGNNDFSGVVGREFYDVYYSNADGTFNLDGEFLTISRIFDATSPAGGGLNLAEIGLNFTGEPSEFGNFVASFTALGDNAFPSTVENAIDGNLLTHTTMGNTVGQIDRLHLTLGFQSSSESPPAESVPEPVSLFGLIAVFGFSAMLRRR
ncbi:MAG: PEP-CTERM sorting domain-containing protein [Okeania sp. SIO3B5]|uniref:PEP-CTERM sorting domain-containing protein n=1 Tax=Okeania sp. SIO3B5 TaxID=2607811 RepID=UPI0013FED658|nr:PEP-CTERM sorting domain-containing protein [Okeania sp. SIO3B5]NEO52937.1 PEP-CTERM sorting domain-containing protein [Okeania sp. SIO3B5]